MEAFRGAIRCSTSLRPTISRRRSCDDIVPVGSRHLRRTGFENEEAAATAWQRMVGRSWAAGSSLPQEQCVGARAAFTSHVEMDVSLEAWVGSVAGRAAALGIALTGICGIHPPHTAKLDESHCYWRCHLVVGPVTTSQVKQRGSHWKASCPTP